MTFAKLCAVLSAGLISFAVSSASPASAGSPVTDAFLANVGANNGFLGESSRIVMQTSATPGLRDFARTEVTEQAQVAQALVRLAPALVVASAGDEVATGRSVAIDGKPMTEASAAASAPAATQTAANGRHALGAAELDRLRTLSGRALDDLYWQQQLDALSQLESDYRTYIRHGDDPALVAMARADLPRVMDRLAALAKL